MRKVGIVTLYGNSNFGNKLQNYALQEFLKKINPQLEVNTLIGEDRRICTRVKKILKKKNVTEREKKFLEFNKFIKYDNNKLNMYKPYISNTYDMLIFGSDQIWNPYFEGKTRLFIGDFNKRLKKVSYAASFGVNSLPPKFRYKYKRSLNKFENISVRETAGQNIINGELALQENITVSIDPTMLLTEDEWEKIEKPPKLSIKKKYILNYFLGELSLDRRREIEKVAKENNCDIINISDINDHYYDSGPSEFLYLERNAFLIFTDSFHASVFALIFNRPFVVFERQQNGISNMNSRIESLIGTFHLKDRIFNGEKITTKNLHYDYNEAYEILKIERKKSEEYLKSVLKNNK